MLPELFSVGNTMQEDFGFLNVNNCYTEKTMAASSTRDSIDLEPAPTSSSAFSGKHTTKVKLEDSSPDINKWPFNYGTNFLRTSVDPLISSVCEQGDNELLRREDTTIFENVSSSKSRKTETTEVTTHVKRVTATRTRRKGPIKLRFHHQALPPEYLNHYESQQQLQETLRHQHQQQQQQQSQQAPAKKKSPVTKQQATPAAASAKSKDVKNNENIISWLQNVLEMQASSAAAEAKPKTRTIPIELPPTTSPSSSTRTQSLKDLPYMGEMTLENMKPRRGRKPKKADICHLIYKNYGTVIPGSAQSQSTVSTLEKKSSTASAEKTTKKTTTSEVKTPKVSQSEPLNLCIRESKEDSIIVSDESSDFTLPPRNGHDFDLEFSSTIPSPLDLTNDIPLPPVKGAASSPPPPGYVYWPSAGIFIHPMALYYQKMMNKKLNHDSSASSSSSSLSSLISPAEAAASSSSLWDHHQNLSPSSMEMRAHDFDVKSEESMSSPPVLSEMLKNTTLDAGARETHASQKRKRSAIFIPPVQSESLNSPTNEVSICKFKFTGGAKPSLQEKKILSVDAGGNFRYFSGTGDKNNRGFEFFPRENLMQSSLSSSSHTNAFLNAESEKIPLELLPPSELSAHKLMHTTRALEQSLFAHPHDTAERTSEERLSRRKKSSPAASASATGRSSQRAKLEKTFKEKGFLIQTQQLQSAEGATYCKFRQLKKFTRYLFRSWKDYLPMDEGGSGGGGELQTNHINIETARSSP